MSGEFRKVDEVVLHGGYIFDLVRADFISPEGEPFRRDIVRHPGAVSVVPIDGEGRVIMVRQYRPALDQRNENSARKSECAPERWTC